MLVKTDYMYPSGEGNPIFSKQGAFNRFQHLSFQERNFQSQRVNLAAMKSIPEEITGENEFLPKILNTNLKQTEEDAKKELNRLMKQIADENNNMAAAASSKRSRTEMGRNANRSPPKK
jgi:hypothetical protein